jgi:hypothetical protein
MFFAALGLVPVSACGGATTPNVTGAAGAGGSDNTTAGAGGSVTTGPTTTGATTTGPTTTGPTTTGPTTTGVTTSGTTGTTGAGGSMPFPCVDPQPVVNAKSGFESCANGSIHRPFQSICLSRLPRPDFMAPDGGFPGCKLDIDCPGPYGYCVGSLAGGYYCTHGCAQDSDCMAGQVCLCGDPVGKCVDATCAVDADCGPGLVCSTYNPSPGCTSTAFACQSPIDLCGGDRDCPAQSACSVVNARRWCAPFRCTDGRPFLVDAEARTAEVECRGGWIADETVAESSRLAAAERAKLASAWTEIALMEHASIAAFARFTLHLLKLAAPASLVELSNQAMADETVHAKLAFTLASGYAGHVIGPGPLDIDGALERCTFRDILVTTIREGCIGETVAAIEAAEALEHVEDSAARRALERIAADEARHAELAWKFVAWALEQGGEEARTVAAMEFAGANECEAEANFEPTRAESALLAAGIVPERLRRIVRAEAMQRVVGVCAEALLEGSKGALAA